MFYHNTLNIICRLREYLCILRVNDDIMLYNFLKIGLRTVFKSPLTSFVKIFSLALSMSICLLIIEIAVGQFDYDKHTPHKDNICRILTSVRLKDQSDSKFATTPYTIKDELRKYPAVFSSVASIKPTYVLPVKAGAKELPLSGAYADPNLFAVFEFPLSGDSKTCLSRPNSIVITEKTALKLFGTSDCNGKVLSINNIDFIITAVINRTDFQSHLNYDFYISDLVLPILLQTQKVDSSSLVTNSYSSNYTYVRTVADNANFDAVLKEIANHINKHVTFTHGEKSYKFTSQSLAEISPRKQLYMDNSPAMTEVSILVFLNSVLIFMLLTCLNYSSLTIAGGMSRAKEIGVRKVLGASKTQIVIQFLIESIIIAFFALLISMALMPFIPLNPSFQLLLSSVHFSAEIFFAFLVFSIVVGLMAGFLPGYLLARFKAVETLKNLSNLRIIKGVNFRKVILVIQFSIACILIFITLIIYKQSSYAITTNYGIDRDDIISIRAKDYAELKLLKNELSRLPEVMEISAISDDFGYEPSGHVKAAIGDELDQTIFSFYDIDENTLKNFKIKLIAGGNFTADPAYNKSKAIINERALQTLHLQSAIAAIGKQLTLNDTVTLTVIGVVKDFNFQNFKNPIAPLLLRYNAEDFRTLDLKIASSHFRNFYLKLGNIKKKLHLQYPIDYAYLKDSYLEQQGHADDVNMLAFLTIMIVVVACLGLIGITSYNIAQRNKEVTIRKVLGAGTFNIFYLLSKEYFSLISIACLTGLPIAYLVSRSFLQKFAFRVDIGFEIFLIVIIIEMALGFMIIMTTSFKLIFSLPITRLD